MTAIIHNYADKVPDETNSMLCFIIIIIIIQL